MADIQTEKAYQKQDGLNISNKYLLFGEALPKRKKNHIKIYFLNIKIKIIFNLIIYKE